MPALDSIVARATPLGDSAVVTATARLARELHHAYDQRQRDDGKSAWESTDALPYDAFLRRAWSDLGADAAHVLLDRAQRAAAWERIIRDDIATRGEAPLWNPRAAAGGATKAWQMAAQWQINLERCAKSQHDDHRSWYRWARHYQRLCEQSDWIDPDCLAERLRAHLADDPNAAKSLPQRIAFAGFDHLTPQQQTLIAALRESGIDAEHLAAPTEPAAVTLREYDDEHAQWHAAACWARAHLQRDADASLAIVAPDLARAADAIDYALRQVLCPQQMIEPATRGAQPHHLSLGAPLSRYPPVQAALLALAPMSGAPMALADIERLIRSPFLIAAEREASARERLTDHLRRRLPYRLRFKRWLRIWEEDDDVANTCPQLKSALHDAADSLRGLERRHTASHWAQQFDQWLRALGWHGERALDSDEFQAARALRQQLRDLARLDLTAAPMTAADAINALRRQCDEQIFQVEARDQQVQVLSVAEAAGQRFDALWLGAMVEDDWPPMPRINAFIAPELQREAGVIGASLDTSRAHALAQQRRLLASADAAVLSYPKVRDEVEIERSPLLVDVVDVADVVDDDAHDRFDTPTQIVHQSKIELERYGDERAPALAPGAASGGISVIENQAKCPFRAFATHRLHAREDEPRAPGLSPAERGALLHRALQIAWEEIKTSQRLHQLARDELDAILNDAAQKSAARYQFRSGCRDGFDAMQRDWICDTLREWFAAERARARSFAVKEMEQLHKLSLAGLELDFRIDRVDRLDGGALALIDYKSGAVGAVGNWVGARPRAPQLPLYALAQQADSDDARALEVVAYGRVRRGECGFVGISAQDGFDSAESPNKVAPVGAQRSLRDYAFDTWHDLIAHWQRNLPALAQAYRDGDARVDPVRADVCAFCDLHSLCRIDADDE